MHSQNKWPEGYFWIRQSDCKCFISDGEKWIAEDGETIPFSATPPSVHIYQAPKTNKK